MALSYRSLLSYRPVYLGGFACCAALMAYALYVQHVEWLDPCPLCVLQRIAFIGMGAIFLVGGLHNPGHSGRLFYAVVIDLIGSAGAGVAAWHIRLQNLPPNEVPDCGPGLEYMVDNLPLSEVLGKVFAGSGECATVDWQFLGLSMPWWTLIWFVGLSVVALVFALKGKSSVA